MTSRCRSTWALAALSIWLAAGCAGNDAPPDGGTGRSGEGGAPASGGDSGNGEGGAEAGGDVGTGGSAAAGAVDGGMTDARDTDDGAPDRGAPEAAGGDAGAADEPRADASADARDEGTDATATFAPCPTDGSACIVMPLGDSITEGYPDLQGGYRVELFHQAIQGGKTITFVGRRANGPVSGMVDGRPFPTGSEGYTGYTIDDAPAVGRIGITTPITGQAIAMFHPHIILLMIGTNDVNLSVDLPNAPARLAALVDLITTMAPAALLVVAQIVPTTTDATNARVQAYNAAIPALVQLRAAAGKHVLLVDMYGTFTSHADYKTALMINDLHPNPTGYALLGQTWYTAIASFLR